MDYIPGSPFTGTKTEIPTDPGRGQVAIRTQEPSATAPLGTFQPPGAPGILIASVERRVITSLILCCGEKGSTDKFIISAEMEVQKKGKGLFTRTNCSLWKGLGLEAKICGSQPGQPVCF